MAYEISISKKVDNTGRSELSLRLRLGKIDQQASTHLRNSLTGEQEIHPLNEVASSHMARRTLTGNLFKIYKDQSLVSSITGHAPNSSAFARYRDIDEDMKREMVSILDL